MTANTGVLKRQSVVFIVNPISGKGLGRQLASDLPPLLNSKLFDVAVKISESKGHARALAQGAVEESADIIVAVGGDGTINEIAFALVNSPTTLCIIPCGSGNGIARHLGIPLTPSKALELIGKGQYSKIDAMEFDDKFCLGIAGIGFDAVVGKKFDESSRRGFRSYVQIVLNEIRLFKPIAVSIDTDDMHIKEDVMLTCIANGSQFGNNAIIAPTASMKNGQLVICVVKKMPVYLLPGFVYALFTGKLQNSKYVHYYSTDNEIHIHQSATWAHVDGEPVEVGHDIKVSLLHQAITMLHPHGEI